MIGCSYNFVSQEAHCGLTTLLYNVNLANAKIKFKYSAFVPAAAITKLKDCCTFSVGDVGSSIREWLPENEAGAPTVAGDKLKATVTFSELPANNSAFGLKEAKLTCTVNGKYEIKNNYEVFFPATKTNHPACSVCADCPNWFYYWKQTEAIAGVTIIYDPTLLLAPSGGHIRGQFSNVAVNEIKIGKRHPLDIDTFAQTLKHESTHRVHYIEASAPVAIDSDGDWLVDSRETSGDYNLNGTLDTEDINNDGVLDPIEDIGLTRKELTLGEFIANAPVRNVQYGAGDGLLTAETGTSTEGTSKYNANTNGGAYDDEDDSCYDAEIGITAVGNDWSKDGKNWNSFINII